MLFKSAYHELLKAGFLLKGPRWSRTTMPELSYAGLCSGNLRPTHGGNVKLMALNACFPEKIDSFNLLYLVSSGLAIRSEAWADACLGRGIKLVWNQNGVAYPAWAPRDYRRLNARMARCLHRAVYVVYQSRFCQQEADRFLGKYQGPSEVLYNAVDSEQFFPKERSASGSEQPLKLLVMGSHESPGRVMAALAASAELKARRRQILLMIIGRLVWPKAKEQIDREIIRLGLSDNVLIRGPYLQKDAPAIYRSADILLHLKHADPCPSVVLEAMACGLPVVGLNSGGVPELVGDGGGLLVPVPQDIEKLYVPAACDVATAVEELALDLPRFQKSARQRVLDHFDTKNWIDQHQRIFQEVLKA